MGGSISKLVNALEASFDNVFKSNNGSLDSVRKDGNQSPLNAGNRGRNSENAALLNTCNNFSGGNQTNGASNALQRFAKVAKTLVEQLGANEQKVSGAANNQNGQTQEIKALLEKLVAAFEKLIEKNGADKANGNQAASNGNPANQTNQPAANSGSPTNQTSQGDQAGGANALNASAPAEGAGDQDPLEQITELLKKLFEAITGQKFDDAGSTDKANQAGKGATYQTAGQNATDAAQSGDPLQQIAALLEQLLAEVQKTQGGETANNAATNGSGASENANAPGSAGQANNLSQTEGAEQSAGSQAASETGDTNEAGNNNELAQFVKLLQELIAALQNQSNPAGQSSKSAPRNDSPANSGNSFNSSSNFDISSMTNIDAGRFNARMSERV